MIYCSHKYNYVVHVFFYHVHVSMQHVKVFKYKQWKVKITERLRDATCMLTLNGAHHSMIINYTCTTTIQLARYVATCTYKAHIVSMQRRKRSIPVHTI